MDFSPYRRQTFLEKKNTGQKWMPIAIACVVIVFCLLVFWAIQVFFSDFNGTVISPRFLTSETSTGEVKGKNGYWQSYVGEYSVLEGDSVRSTHGNDVQLVFPETSIVRFTPGTETQMLQAREDDEGKLHAKFLLIKGEVWVDIRGNTEITFLLPNSISATSSGGIMTVSSESVRVPGNTGSVTVSYLIDDATVDFSNTINFGQETIFSPGNFSPASRRFPIQSISPDFYDTDFYRTWMGLETLSPTPTPSDLVDTPVITEPGKTDESVTTTKDTIKIVGKTSDSTVNIIVEYEGEENTLSSFEEGDTKWTYTVSVEDKTLMEGKNVYRFYAEDEEGSRSAPAKITITYEKEEDDESENVTGSLAVTSPSLGDTETASPIVIKGSAPSNAAYIQVNDYTLQQFKKGSATWRYNHIDPKKGENRYVIKALNEDKEVLETINFSLIYEGESTPTPLPTATVTPRVTSTSTPIPSVTLPTSPTPTFITTPTPTPTPSYTSPPMTSLPSTPG